MLISYVAGSIPSAYLAGKAKGVDLRQHGSGNLGATNVVRVLGPRIGAAVFIVDLLKGFLPVYLLPPITDTSRVEWWALAFGVAAILGHVRPVFLLGRGGGKGVATAGGVFFALALIPMLVAQAVWMTIFFSTKFVSLASIVSALSLPLAILFWMRDPLSPLFIGSVVIALFVVWNHRSNIGRLRRGEEPRFVKRAKGS